MSLMILSFSPYKQVITKFEISESRRWSNKLDSYRKDVLLRTEVEKEKPFPYFGSVTNRILYFTYLFFRNCDCYPFVLFRFKNRDVR